MGGPPRSGSPDLAGTRRCDSDAVAVSVASRRAGPMLESDHKRVATAMLVRSDAPCARTEPFRAVPQCTGHDIDPHERAPFRFPVWDLAARFHCCVASIITSHSLATFLLLLLLVRDDELPP